MSAMVCPRCGNDEHVVMVEDGVWMCTQCTIEFNGDGRAMGGLVEIGKIGYLFGKPIDDVFVATVSASAPLKDMDVPTVMVEISFKSVGNVDELMRELYESLKRASE
jgi:hypothetical protein